MLAKNAHHRRHGLNTGAAEYKNMGDIAMLQVAVARLLALWPDASIEVLTESPSCLARYCPGAAPLPRVGCRCLVEDRELLGRYHEFLPKWASVRLSVLKKAIGLHWPKILESLSGLKLISGHSNDRRNNFKVFLEALRNVTCWSFAVRGDLQTVAGAGTSRS